MLLHQSAICPPYSWFSECLLVPSSFSLAPVRFPGLSHAGQGDSARLLFSILREEKKHNCHGNVWVDKHKKTKFPWLYIF